MVQVQHLRSYVTYSLAHLDICNGSSTTLSVSGTFSSYNWAPNGETTPSITADAGGVYSVTVTDSNGCEATDMVTVNEGSVTVNITGDEIVCGTNGTTTLDAGAGFASYLWDDMANSTSQMITVGAGTYNVTITDADGCEGTDVITITANDPMVNITGDEIVCGTNGTTILTATGGFASYLWDDMANSTSEMITVGAGTYNVTVTDADGCTATNVITITTNDPMVDITGDEIVCGTNGTTILTATGGFASYLWDDMANSTSEMITVGAGTYNVTVTDADGCTATNVITITTNDPMVDITGDEIVCGTNGTTILTATGGFASYLWDDMANSTSEMITVGAGTYNVTVTDADGCTATNVITVTTNDPMVNILGDNTVCENQTTTLSTDGTFATYMWSDGSTMPTLADVGADTYTVTVTDADGCTAVSPPFIIIETEVTPVVLGDSHICGTGNTTLTVQGNFDTYQWDDAANSTTQSIPVEAGTYTVTVTDANGCTGESEPFTVTSSDPMPIITGDLMICPGEMTTLDAGNFTSYEWSNGETGQTIEVDANGTFDVTVTDANGCTAVSPSVTVQQNNISVNILGDNTVCEGETTTLSTDDTFATYMWSDGSTMSTLADVGADTYTVTVTDADGCTAENDFTVTEVILSPVIAGDAAICNGVAGTLSVTDVFDTYLWNTGETGQSIQVTTAGTYSVIVTDNTSGCTGETSFTVTESNPTTSISGNTTVCAGESTILTADGNFASYLWNTGETSPSIEVTNSGTYSVEVTDASGCTTTASTTVTVNTPATVSINANPGTEINAGSTTTLNTTGATSGSTYVWSTGETTSSIDVTEEGTYTVTVTDENGCETTASITITVLFSDLQMPNIFTPNNDDLNDSLYPVYSDPSVSIIEFKVYDRWGELVHDDETTPWDGTYSGKPMPADIYVYFLRYSANGAEEFMKGDVNLMR